MENAASSQLFRSNEDAFLDALQSCEIVSSAPAHGMAAGGDLGRRSLTGEQVRENLGDHLRRRDRSFDILLFRGRPGEVDLHAGMGIDSPIHGEDSRGLPHFELTYARSSTKRAVGALAQRLAQEAGDLAGPGEQAPPAQSAHAQQSSIEGSGPGVDVRPVVVERELVRVGDRQRKCILDLNPTLLYPTRADPSLPGAQPLWEEATIARGNQLTCCSNERDRKSLGNYKNTGFCGECLRGEGTASEDAWVESGFRTLRGFNLPKRQGESRMRHMLCLEFPESQELGGQELGGPLQAQVGKCFLKWCTQCHLWKNFCEFYTPAVPGVAGPAQVGTFCEVCNVRQQLSRQKQLAKRRDARKRAREAAPETPSPEGAKKAGSSVTEGQIGIAQAAQAAATGQNVQQLGNFYVTTAYTGGYGAPPETTTSMPHSNEEGEDAAARAARQARGREVARQAGKRERAPPLSSEEQANILRMQVELLAEMPLLDFPFWHPNEDDFVSALDNVKVCKTTLRTFLLSPERLADILYFKYPNIPVFSEECNPIPKRGALSLDMAKPEDGIHGDRPFQSYRISDRQQLCICSMGPELIRVDEEDQRERLAAAAAGLGESALLASLQDSSPFGFPLARPVKWQHVRLAVEPCAQPRSLPQVKKLLENYKFSGFCPSCVSGGAEGTMASQQVWERTGGRSVRGFNMGRKKVDSRPRHMLCLESQDGVKVFLKWCTQCHTWKNFSSFLNRPGDNKDAAPCGALNTFCAICNRRQKVSRKIHRLQAKQQTSSSVSTERSEEMVGVSPTQNFRFAAVQG